MTNDLLGLDCVREKFSVNRFSVIKVIINFMTFILSRLLYNSYVTNHMHCKNLELFLTCLKFKLNLYLKKIINSNAVKF